MLKPVYALVGTDLFLQLDNLGQLLRSGAPDAQRIDYDGQTAQLADVLDELRSFAMFSSAKVVVVRDADEFISHFRESIENYVAKPAPGSTLILRVNSLPSNQRIYKLISSTGQVLDCKPPKDISRWIIEHAGRAHKLTMSLQAAQLLQDLIGDDLGRLDNELAKLAIQADGKQVDPALISQTVAFQRDQEMWHMTDEVAAGDVAGAVQRWRQLVQMDSSAEFRAVTWLTIWLEKVRKSILMKQQGRNESMIARELKIWPAQQQKAFFQTVSRIGEDGTRKLLSLLAEVDYQSKTGLGDMATNVERFLLEVGRII